MRRLTLLATITLVALSPTATSPAAATEDPVRRIEESYDAADLAELAVDVEVGWLTLTGTDDDVVRLELSVSCDSGGWSLSSCAERVEDVELTATRDGNRLQLDVSGPSSWTGISTLGNRGLEIRMEILAPARLAASMELGIGEMSVEDMTGDLSLHAGIGELRVRMAADHAASARLDIGIGEAVLRADSRRREISGLFAGELSWDEGPGRARIRADVGIGEIDVRLE